MFSFVYSVPFTRVARGRYSTQTASESTAGYMPVSSVSKDLNWAMMSVPVHDLVLALDDRGKPSDGYGTMSRASACQSSSRTLMDRIEEACTVSIRACTSPRA
jgi:hypothetical protein